MLMECAIRSIAHKRKKKQGLGEKRKEEKDMKTLTARELEFLLDVVEENLQNSLSCAANPNNKYISEHEENIAEMNELKGKLKAMHNNERDRIAQQRLMPCS